MRLPYFWLQLVSVPLDGSPHSSSGSLALHLSSFTAAAEIHVYLLQKPIANSQ